MNEIEYSLLELIENPKRINNINHCKLFDYLLQAKESQDRFESYILALYKSHFFAALGFALMSSDIVPLKNIFKDKFQQEDSNKKNNGGTELAIFQQLITYFERKYILSQRNIGNFCSHAYESLSYDEYLFIKTIFNQKYKDDVYGCFKTMYENGKLPKTLAEWFSFSMDRTPLKTNKYSAKFYSVKNSEKYFKVKNVLIDMNGQLVNENETVKILNYIRRVSCPNVCELYLQDKKPYMIVSTDRSLFVDTFKEPLDFIKAIYEGNTNLLFIDGTTVVSIANLENKFFTKKKINCKSINMVTINNVSMHKEIPILLCRTEKDETFVVYIPYDLKDFDSYKTKTSIEVIEYQNNLYLRG